MVLDRFELAGKFDVVQAADDVEGASKPDPRPYRRAVESIDIKPEAGIAVEDSRHGVESAVRAGMTCIALRGAGNRESDLSAADVIVEDPASLRAALEARIPG